MVPLILVGKISMLIPLPDVGGTETLERSFDFSKFPNLQEVHFDCRISWRGGGLPWVPVALSTLRPAPSPRLSAIRLVLVRSPIIRSIKTLIEDTGHDLRRVADELTRIEREFEGAVSLTVVTDSGFGVVLDTLEVRFRSYG